MPDFGRRLLHDPKSREHASPARKAARNVNVRHAMNAAHVDQFYLSGCVGFGGTNWLNTVYAQTCRRKMNGVTRQRFDGRYLGNDNGIRNYHEATLRDPFEGEYPPTDEGSSAVGLMKWWQSAGVISAYHWTFTFDAFLAALQAQPVLVGTNWYDDMMSTGADGVVHSSASGPGGGHEYLATEIDWGRRLIGYEQSWGEHPPGFGIQGRFFIPMDLAEELIIHQQGDVAVPIGRT